MTSDPNFSEPKPDLLKQEYITLERAAVFDRMESILALLTRGPSAEDIASAPRIDRWEVMVSPSGAPVLWGHVTGHPRLGHCELRTSRVIGMDHRAGWARTYGRWYVLGPSRADFEPGAAAITASVDLRGFRPLRDEAGLTRLMAAFIARAQQEI